MCTKIKQNDFIKIELNRNRAKTILLKCGKQKKYYSKKVKMTWV